MKTRAALITTYNPGAAGPRFVAGQLMRAGHDVKFFHLKELRAVAIPTTDFEQHDRLRRLQTDIQYVPFQHPGEVLYVPYPSPVTEREADLLIEQLREYDPHVIGITMFSVTVEIARRVTRWIHERLPGKPVIWGGIHCMVYPEDCLRGLEPDPATGRRDPLQVPDIICAAEGEIPMTQLMDRWEEYARGEIPEIPGLWFVREGEVRRFPRLPFETDLDTFAFPVYAHKEVLIDDDRLDFKFEQPSGFIQNHIYVFTERGCPYRCSFCIHSVINKMDGNYQRVRRRSVENVLEEVARRVEINGMRHMVIHDEIFAIQKPWVMEFAEKWERRFKPLGVTFTGYVHPMTTDFEMLEALWRAGLTRTGIGLQTGSARTSKEVYDRPLHRDRVIQISEWLARFPFEIVQIDLISDSPYETDEDRRQTLELLLDMKPPFRVETFSLVTYSTSELAHKKKLMDEVPWNERLFWNMLYHLTGTSFLSRETILGLSHVREFRENPLLLERLAVDLNGQYFRQLKGQLRPEESEAAASAARRVMEERARAEEHGEAISAAAAPAPEGRAPGPNDWQGYRFKTVERREGG